MKILRFKGSVAPTIAISIYQADSVAKFYGNFGYLIAIVSFISLPILPRAKFLQSLLLDLIAVCLATAVSMLGVWSGVRLENHFISLSF